MNDDPFNEFTDALAQQVNANTDKWGGEAHDRGHTRADWLAILEHQVAKLRYEMHFNTDPVSDHFDARLVKLAAVCAAAWGRTRA